MTSLLLQQPACPLVVSAGVGGEMRGMGQGLGWKGTALQVLNGAGLMEILQRKWYTSRPDTLLVAEVFCRYCLDFIRRVVRSA